MDYRALKLDLSSQKAVRAAATEVLSWTDIPAIDIAVNSAGVMNLPERQLSEEGIEMHFATNHIGHFLFTSLLMPKFLKAAKGNPKGATRIVNITSLSPTVSPMRWSDLNFEKINKDLPQAEQPPYQMHKMFGVLGTEEMSYVPIEGYSQSKVANVLFGIALNDRLYEKYGVLSLSCHPGIIQTELSRYAASETVAAIQEILKNVHVKTLGAGASTSLVAALDPGLGMPVSKDGKENYGAYLIDCQISDKALPAASSSAEAERLWKLSQDLVKEQFAW